ncbi:sensor histidine kinase [Salinibacterium hongtaonis]|uniref:histidine kinase n=1 Tax=Homoserinimonas hongtaonis TaxID=2079791 RepID=A0A2U1T3V7_9MICO|nr:HAMP domain-containing sensor histidine kinase [Salinibacterium hongtaonis]AWB90476.1 sensor histidine kinase [Salinibacterium hongtaonis]PWB98564.1 sensor histidine kinase [Salinibacterium hongtaonis]
MTASRPLEWWDSISLRTKITGVTVFIVTAGLLVAGVGTMSVLRTYLLDRVDDNIKSAAADITAWQIDLDTDSISSGSLGPSPFYMALVDYSGKLIEDNLDKDEAHLRPVLSELTLPTVIQLEGAVTLQNATHTSQTRVVAFPVENVDTGNVATLVIGQRLDETNATITRYTAIFLGFALSVVVLSAALTRLLVTSTFRPLREVEATAAAIAGGDFSQRLPGATPNTEVGRLNRSLNVMLGRIDRAFADRARTIDQMRRFVGDASHELRTPLVSVRGYAELYRMGALEKPEDVAQAMERIEKEAIRMGELVEDLLELARADEKKPLRLAPVDLLPLAHDAALDAMAQAPDRTVSVRVEEPELAPSNSIQSEPEPANRSATTGPIAFAGAQLARLRSLRSRSVRQGASSPADEPAAPEAEYSTLVVPAVVLGEENKLRQVITNLIGNALRFTPDGSPIDLVVRVDAVRRTAQLDIVDHGEGVPPQIRDKIFQRFWRADTSRTRETGGSGLGLAIVAAIVDAHKGNVTVLETPGGGATFRLTLPLLPDDYVSPPRTPKS